MDLKPLIQAIGLAGVFIIVFAESGLLIGFFLPGDSLLFTAGFLASQNVFDIKYLAIGSFIAAVLGDSVGYEFGKKVGPRLFKREDSLLFHKKNLVKAKEFYEKHGKITIVIARFMPFIRTFAPIVAGVGEMKYKTFISYNIIGGFIWAVGISVAGYLLGRLGSEIIDVDKYLLPIIALIIFVSILPGFFHIMKDKERRKHFIVLVISVVKKATRFLKIGV